MEKCEVWCQAHRNGIQAIAEGEWIRLEAGIVIRFEIGGEYRSGDYGVFAARTAPGTIEELVEEASHGTEYHYAPLALMTWIREGDRLALVIEDLRTVFRTLKEIEAKLEDLRRFRDEGARCLQELGCSCCRSEGE